MPVEKQKTLIPVLITTALLGHARDQANKRQTIIINMHGFIATSTP
jgi:hypothetical protein